MNPANEDTMTDLYKNDGVDLEAGDDFSSVAAKIGRDTWENNSHFIEVVDLSRGGFRGPRGFRLKTAHLREGALLTATSDGSGTKTIMTVKSLTMNQAAHDVIAMCCGDITRYGGIPLLFMNVLDVKSLGVEGSHLNEYCKELIRGMKDAADEESVVIFGGETAELGVCVGSEDVDEKFAYNWAGFAIGAYHPDFLVNGEDLAEYQAVIALKEDGFRSNGMSTVRRAFSIHFGEQWWEHHKVREYLAAAATPSKLYDRFLTNLNGWYNPFNRVKVSAIAHITGGGIPEKFGKELLFRAGLSAELRHLWDPPEIMRNVADWRQEHGELLTDEAFYRTFNGGQGVLLVADRSEVRHILQRARVYGHQAKVCGYITASKGTPTLTIESKYRQGKIIEYKMA
jgi:phosphoribosylformylglycinamidine cyclo-ligase